MVTLLAFPVVDQLPKSFAELAFSPSHYQIGFMKQGDSAFQVLTQSKFPVYMKISSGMEIISGEGLSCLQKVVTKKRYACIGYNFALDYLREKYLADGDIRQLVFSPARTYELWLGFGFEKKSIYIDNFGKLLGYTRTFHLTHIWYQRDLLGTLRKEKLKRWKSDKNTQGNDKSDKNEDGAESDFLGLRNVAGAFYVLIGCLAASTAVFLKEILEHYFHTRESLKQGKINNIF